jgi:hypothetical protein
MNDLVFRKSSYSGGQSADCVEVAATGTGVAVRDSKAPSGAQLRLSAGQWRALIKSHSLNKVTALKRQRAEQAPDSTSPEPVSFPAHPIVQVHVQDASAAQRAQTRTRARAAQPVHLHSRSLTVIVSLSRLMSLFARNVQTRARGARLRQPVRRLRTVIATELGHQPPLWTLVDCLRRSEPGGVAHFQMSLAR